MKDKWKKHIYPHGDLMQLDERLWMVTGSLPKGNLPRNMIIYRLNSGDLLIHSAIALNQNLMHQIEALGRLKYLLVPNSLHRLDAKKVNKKVTVINTVEEVLPQLGITYHIPSQNRMDELAYEFKLSQGKALIFCDLLFNLDHLPGLSGWILKVLGSSGFFGVTRIGNFFIKDHQKLKKWFFTMAEMSDLQIISVAHGPPITENCNTRLYQVAQQL